MIYRCSVPTGQHKAPSSYLARNNSLLNVHAWNAFRDVAQHLIGNRVAVICVLPGIDVAMLGRADYEHLIPYGNRINIGNVDKREVHGNATHNQAYDR
jgi:hypothetical protein